MTRVKTWEDSDTKEEKWTLSRIDRVYIKTDGHLEITGTTVQKLLDVNSDHLAVLTLAITARRAGWIATKA